MSTLLSFAAFHKVYLSLGGNQGLVLQNLKKACQSLVQQLEIKHFCLSSFYSTAPVQMESEEWFVNAVCRFETSLSPLELFALTQKIETEGGKVNKAKNMSRPIDIDILFYGEQTFSAGDLHIPHLRWKERLFVLRPLSDLTEKISVYSQNGERLTYFLEQLIADLCLHSNQAISLLEENPIIQ